jgi:hypothetical protein
MNLPEPPPPGGVFFSGPQDPAEGPAWLAGLKAWRADRLTRLRYDGSQYTQLFSQVQQLIWDRTFTPRPPTRAGIVIAFMWRLSTWTVLQ